MTVNTEFVAGFRCGNERAFLPVSSAELLRTQSLIERLLKTFNFARGRFVLLISMLENGAYAVPFERALMNLGLLVSNADDSPYEAARIESICRRFDVAAIVGVSTDVLDGLDAAGHSLSALFENRVVWAHGEAVGRLRSIDGIKPYRMLEAGPAFAMECAERDGAHLDASEWTLEVHRGELLVSSRLERAQSFARYATDVRGDLIMDLCRCGLSDIRIRVEHAL